MNLLHDPWMPVRDHAGSRHWITPDRLSGPDLVAFDADRPDFNSALAQFAIGLLQTATPVQSEIGRRYDMVMHEKKRLLVERGCVRWSQWPGAERPALTDLVRQTCLGWLLARAGRIGCTFDEPSLMAEGYTQHRGKADELRFSSVDFNGGLTVADAAAFTVALTRGVGHAKAFGYGLLLVKPLR